MENEVAYRKHFGYSSDSYDSESNESDESCDGKPPPKPYLNVVKISAQGIVSGELTEENEKHIKEEWNTAVSQSVETNTNDTKQHLKNKLFHPKSLFHHVHKYCETCGQIIPNKISNPSSNGSFKENSENHIECSYLQDLKEVDTLMLAEDFGISSHYFYDKSFTQKHVKTNADIITISSVPQFKKPVLFLNKNKTSTLENILRINQSDIKPVFSLGNFFFQNVKRKSKTSTIQESKKYLNKDKTFTVENNLKINQSKNNSELTFSLENFFIPDIEKQPKITSTFQDSNKILNKEKTWVNVVNNSYSPSKILPVLPKNEMNNTVLKPNIQNNKSKSSNSSDNSFLENSSKQLGLENFPPLKLLTGIEKSEISQKQSVSNESLKRKRRSKSNMTTTFADSSKLLTQNKRFSSLAEQNIANHFLEFSKKKEKKSNEFSPKISNKIPLINFLSPQDLTVIQKLGSFEVPATTDKSSKQNKKNKKAKKNTCLKLFSEENINTKPEISFKTNATKLINEKIVIEDKDVLKVECKLINSKQEQQNVDKTRRQIVLKEKDIHVDTEITESELQYSSSVGKNEDNIDSKKSAKRSKSKLKKKSEHDFMDPPATVIEHPYFTKLAENKWDHTSSFIEDQRQIVLKRKDTQVDTEINNYELKCVSSTDQIENKIHSKKSIKKESKRKQNGNSKHDFVYPSAITFEHSYIDNIAGKNWNYSSSVIKTSGQSSLEEQNIQDKNILEKSLTGVGNVVDEIDIANYSKTNITVNYSKTSNCTALNTQMNFPAEVSRTEINTNDNTPLSLQHLSFNALSKVKMDKNKWDKNLIQNYGENDNINQCESKMSSVIRNKTLEDTFVSHFKSKQKENFECFVNGETDMLNRDNEISSSINNISSSMSGVNPKILPILLDEKPKKKKRKNKNVKNNQLAKLINENIEYHLINSKQEQQKNKYEMPHKEKVESRNQIVVKGKNALMHTEITEDELKCSSSFGENKDKIDSEKLAKKILRSKQNKKSKHDFMDLSTTFLEHSYIGELAENETVNQCESNISSVIENYILEDKFVSHSKSDQKENFECFVIGETHILHRDNEISSSTNYTSSSMCGVTQKILPILLDEKSKKKKRKNKNVKNNQLAKLINENLVSEDKEVLKVEYHLINSKQEQQKNKYEMPHKEKVESRNQIVVKGKDALMHTEITEDKLKSSSSLSENKDKIDSKKLAKKRSRSKRKKKNKHDFMDLIDVIEMEDSINNGNKALENKITSVMHNNFQLGDNPLFTKICNINTVIKNYNDVSSTFYETQLLLNIPKPETLTEIDINSENEVNSNKISHSISIEPTWNCHLLKKRKRKIESPMKEIIEEMFDNFLANILNPLVMVNCKKYLKNSLINESLDFKENQNSFIKGDKNSVKTLQDTVDQMFNDFLIYILNSQTLENSQKPTSCFNNVDTCEYNSNSDVVLSKLHLSKNLLLSTTPSQNEINLADNHEPNFYTRWVVETSETPLFRNEFEKVYVDKTTDLSSANHIEIKKNVEVYPASEDAEQVFKSLCHENNVMSNVNFPINCSLTKLCDNEKYKKPEMKEACHDVINTFTGLKESELITKRQHISLEIDNFYTDVSENSSEISREIVSSMSNESSLQEYFEFTEDNQDIHSLSAYSLLDKKLEELNINIPSHFSSYNLSSLLYFNNKCVIS